MINFKNKAKKLTKFCTNGMWEKIFLKSRTRLFFKNQQKYQSFQKYDFLKDDYQVVERIGSQLTKIRNLEEHSW